MLFRQCALENPGSGHFGSGSPLSNIIFSYCAEIYEIEKIRKSQIALQLCVINLQLLCSCV